MEIHSTQLGKALSYLYWWGVLVEERAKQAETRAAREGDGGLSGDDHLPLPARLREGKTRKGKKKFSFPTMLFRGTENQSGSDSDEADGAVHFNKGHEEGFFDLLRVMDDRLNNTLLLP
uniref:Uncharacterized protein n=1 Tax=Palpitomonas bilix TaxID=652834 RepID=A0A7S3LW71_9EUKA